MGGGFRGAMDSAEMAETALPNSPSQQGYPSEIIIINNNNKSRTLDFQTVITNEHAIEAQIT